MVSAEQHLGGGGEVRRAATRPRAAVTIAECKPANLVQIDTVKKVADAHRLHDHSAQQPGKVHF
jgi:hypothetical protein